MHGQLSEFTLAQLLQFFALAERSGTIMVKAKERTSRLIVEGDRISGWGLDDFDVRKALIECELLPTPARAAIEAVTPHWDTPGLSFVVRNYIEPERWQAFSQRQLEQDIYPLLSHDRGSFEVEVAHCPPAPLRLSLPVNSLILDGSRWESEMEAAEQDGYGLRTTWRRSTVSADPVRLTGLEWMVWAVMSSIIAVGEVARRLCFPDLATISAIKRLEALRLVTRSDG